MKETDSKVKLRTAKHCEIPQKLRVKNVSPVENSELISVDAMKTTGMTISPEQMPGIIANLAAISAAGHDAILTASRKSTKDGDHQLTITYKVRED